MWEEGKRVSYGLEEVSSYPIPIAATLVFHSGSSGWADHIVNKDLEQAGCRPSIKAFATLLLPETLTPLCFYLLLPSWATSLPPSLLGLIRSWTFSCNIWHAITTVLVTLKGSVSLTLEDHPFASSVILISSSYLLWLLQWNCRL